LEGGLGQDPRLERGVVGGDELDLDEVLAGAQSGKAFVEAVLHGDQLAVDQQMDVTLVGPDAGAGLADDSWRLEAKADLGGLAVDGRCRSGLALPSRV
jgi:hypothetical protein